MPLDTDINDRIAHCALSPAPGFGPPTTPVFSNLVGQGVFIANAWDTVNVTGIGKPTGPGAGGVDTAISIVSKAHFSELGNANLSAIKLMNLGWQNGRPTLAEVSRSYLDWGATKARNSPFFGYCEAFACATIAVLVATNTPLPQGMTVEWFGMIPNGITGRGHAFAVVNRLPLSDPATPAGWGPNCVVVDQWYALQAGTPAAVFVNGPQRSASYMNWLTGPGNVLYQYAAFPALGYLGLAVPIRA